MLSFPTDGTVTAIDKGIIVIDGLETASIGSFIRFYRDGESNGESHASGVVLGIGRHSVYCLCSEQDGANLQYGDVVVHVKGEVTTMPVGEAVRGRQAASSCICAVRLFAALIALAVLLL